MSQLSEDFDADEHGDDAGQERLEEREAEERRSPGGKVVYKAVMKEADEELVWSGLAAGLSMGFSLVAEGLLRHHLPQASWTPAVTKLGYAFGFLIVILGRQQLFTENTLTPILPLLHRKDLATLVNVLRLWGVVLAANLLGALAFALVAERSAAFEPDVRREFLALGHEAMKHGFGADLLRGIFAGWLIALLVWMLPYSESAHFFVIVSITWLVGLGQFGHVVAGATEVFVLGWAGAKPWGTVLGSYLLPTLLGNIIGGVTLVAALNHAQVTSGDQSDE
jgi:formate/nitrite transporter FocA (FNT family)